MTETLYLNANKKGKTVTLDTRKQQSSYDINLSIDDIVDSKMNYVSQNVVQLLEKENSRLKRSMKRNAWKSAIRKRK